MVSPATEKKFLFKVLIVDDDATILGLLKEIISMVPDCHVTTAGDPKDAMAYIAQGDIDIVITDIHMPGVTGLEMIQDIIALDHTPEIIVMTAFPSGEIASQAMELGASSLLSKPFEDISLVELELEKAIKKILRQRASAEEVAEKKAELAKIDQAPDNDEPMKVSLDPSLAEPEKPSAEKADQVAVPQSAEPASSSAPEAASLQICAKVYAEEVLEPFIDIEVNRCNRYNRQFAFGLVDIPEDFQVHNRQEREKQRTQQVEALQSCFRTSDLIVDLGKEGFAVVCFECNKAGASVVEFKLSRLGFEHSGFSVYPTDGKSLKDLRFAAQERLQNKRRHRILILEPEEFYGRIVQNMLLDPKYHVTWTKSFDDAYSKIVEGAEAIKLMVVSLTKDAAQWSLLAKLKKEKLSNWPILLFTDVPLDSKLRSQLMKLGVKAIVKKGSSQEEFLYVVQSFVMQGSVTVLRKNPRALVTLPVLYRNQGNEVSSNTFTLSRDGVFIRDMNPPASGDRVDMEIIIPGRKGPMKAQGEVLYSVPYFVGVNRIHVPGMALKFIDLPEADQKDLDRYIAEAMTSYLTETE